MTGEFPAQRASNKEMFLFDDVIMQHVLLALETLCSSTKLTSVFMLSAYCVFHVFGCALSVDHLRSQI